MQRRRCIPRPFALCPREQREIGIVNPKTPKEEIWTVRFRFNYPSVVGSGEAAQGISVEVVMRGNDLDRRILDHSPDDRQISRRCVGVKP